MKQQEMLTLGPAADRLRITVRELLDRIDRGAIGWTRGDDGDLLIPSDAVRTAPHEP